MLAKTPPPPYYAVIFSSIRQEPATGYASTAARMLELAEQQPGFLGVESARSEIGITVSYWETEAAIRQWKAVAEHRLAQERGRGEWYAGFEVRVAKVERAYSFRNS